VKKITRVVLLGIIILLAEVGLYLGLRQIRIKRGVERQQDGSRRNQVVID